ncbi:MAG: PTPDL family protein [Chthoniobacterales bacterium]
MRLVFNSFLFVLGASFLLADTVQLKSGEKVQGNIILTTPNEVVMEINISPTIRDERTIPRSEVVKIDAVGPDQQAYNNIKNLTPDPTVLEQSYYDEVIRTKIEPFLKDYDYSPYVTNVRAIRDVFLKEKARMVKSNEVKFEGAWLNKADYEKDRYQIDASALLSEIKAADDRQEYPLVLNLYDRMKRDYPKAGSFPESVTIAKENMNTVEKMIAGLLVKITDDDAKREQQLIQTTAAEQQQVRQALANQKAAMELAIANARKSSARYITLYPSSREALIVLRDAVVVGKKELAALPLEAMQQSLKCARDAQKNMDSFQITAAQGNIDEAKKLWPDNALIGTMEERLKLCKDELEKSNKAQKDSVQRAAP